MKSSRRSFLASLAALFIAPKVLEAQGEKATLDLADIQWPALGTGELKVLSVESTYDLSCRMRCIQVDFNEGTVTYELVEEPEPLPIINTARVMYNPNGFFTMDDKESDDGITWTPRPSIFSPPVFPPTRRVLRLAVDRDRPQQGTWIDQGLKIGEVYHVQMDG